MRTDYVTFILLMVGLVVNTNAAPPQVSLDVTVVGDGKVMSAPSGIDCRTGDVGCTGNFKKSTIVILKATADPGSSFLMWEGDCAGTQPTCEIKVSAPAIVTATFDTATVTYPAPVPQTGQISCWNGAGSPISCANTGQDGDIQSGVSIPSPRFTDNKDGTTTDSLTGLTWLQDSLCISGTWEDMLAFSKSLSHGQCGLTDDSNPGDWKMPNVNEFMSLIDFETGRFPADNYFIGLPPPTSATSYWTSTTAAFNTSLAYRIHFQLDGTLADNSTLDTGSKELSASSLLPVRAH